MSSKSGNNTKLESQITIISILKKKNQIKRPPPVPLPSSICNITCNTTEVEGIQLDGVSWLSVHSMSLSSVSIPPSLSPPSPLLLSLVCFVVIYHQNGHEKYRCKKYTFQMNQLIDVHAVILYGLCVMRLCVFD